MGDESQEYDRGMSGLEAALGDLHHQVELMNAANARDISDLLADSRRFAKLLDGNGDGFLARLIAIETALGLRDDSPAKSRIPWRFIGEVVMAASVLVSLLIGLANLR